MTEQWTLMEQDHNSQWERGCKLEGIGKEASVLTVVSKQPLAVRSATRLNLCGCHIHAVRVAIQV